MPEAKHGPATGSDPDGPRPDGPERGIDRRAFVTVAGLTVLGVAVGCTRVASSPSVSPIAGSATPSVPSTPAATPPRAAAVAVPAGWSPLADLTTVSVAAHSSARGYPALRPGEAFDRHPAVVLFERSLAQLSGGSALDAVKSGVAPGGTVVIKPNWVEPGKWDSGKITHPSLVLAAARLASQAVGPDGHVWIAEGTSEGRDLPKILAATTFMRALKAFGLDGKTDAGAAVKVVDLNLPSTGSHKIALGGASRFAHVSDELFGASNHSLGTMGEGRVGTYLIASPITDADLVIDFAKAKVHCSAGVTLALKNFVGIVPSGTDSNGAFRLKDIPHSSAADKRAGRQYVLNRTIGRTVADLQSLAAYVAKDGSLQGARQRKLLCVVDGIVSGERNQFAPSPVRSGWIAAGFDPVAVDHVAARCMGFDPELVQSFKPSRSGALSLGASSPNRIRVAFDGPKGFGDYFTRDKALRPESIVAEWGDAIALNRFGLRAPEITRNGSQVVVRTSGSPAAVRLESPTAFANLSKSGEGTFATSLPADAVGPLRVVVMDLHFNTAEAPVQV